MKKGVAAVTASSIEWNGAFTARIYLLLVALFLMLLRLKKQDECNDKFVDNCKSSFNLIMAIIDIYYVLGLKKGRAVDTNTCRNEM